MKISFSAKLKTRAKRALSSKAASWTFVFAGDVEGVS